MGKELKLSDFKCKKCGKYMWRNGRVLGQNLVFFMCLSKNGGCCNSEWIDIIRRMDGRKRIYD